ncbi:hypothetical protein C7448_103326 [Tenacibaculum gallaicum]|uniref:Tic20 family protein n=1 Tax=Tenacibaculum gallaicum TaxID=561505 RepID=A0A3E0I1W4_9FLAO|nr:MULTISPECIES: hypothetical protein [Tenacibaculum]MDX8554727.1 hypothetical protein [Tenacibaculum sp. 1B UA]REH52591.1 hypothetical protein C7448_103326 [Tenacibaculum gallaicum]
MENQTVNEGKTPAIISHFTVIGLIIAFVLNMNNKNAFASFYIRQMLGLNILYMANMWIVYKYLGSTIGWVVGVLLFVLWLISLLAVLKGEKKLVPVVGEQFQNLFKGI